MKKIILMLLTILGLFFVACGNDSGEKKANESTKKEILKIGTNASYPPFEYTVNGSEIVGFDIDLIKEISEIVGFDYEIVNMDFDGIIPALKTGKIDLAISAMSSTPERQKSVSFSKVYYSDNTIYFIKKADNDDINTLEDLHGKKIGVFLGTVQDLYATKLANDDKSITLVRSNDIFNTIINLKSDKVDVALSDGPTGRQYVEKNSDIISFLELPDGSDGFAIAFELGKHQELIDKINSAIDTLKAMGSMKNCSKSIA